MVKFVASLVAAAAVLARVTSAVPMEYGAQSSSSSAPPSMTTPSKNYDSGSAYGEKGSSSYAAPPTYTMSSDKSSYGSDDKKSSYSPSSYGSGSASWKNGDYDNCVQQCVAQFGKPSSMYMPPSPTSSGSSGPGKTHTVIVAPTKGVLRYVPFALNASVGDTVQFMWGADNHTVTKSSQLSLCNKTGEQPFTSGEQNKSFVFSQVINDTNPLFVYCGTPTHCQKGLFGIVNPPSAYMAASTMMPSLASKYPSVEAGMSYANNATSNQSTAASWGMNIKMDGMPDWAQQYAAENVLYTRAFLGANPNTIKEDGSIDFAALSTTGGAMVPMDVAAAMSLNNADNSQGSYGSPASSSAPSASATAVGGSSKSTNGAGALSSPRVAVAFVALAAAFFAL